MSLSPLSLANLAQTPIDIGAASRSAGAGADGAPFGNLVDRFLGSAVQSNTDASQAVRDLALGRTDAMHEVMMKVAQADLSFRLILEIRNKLTDAYQEITKMQV